MQFYGQAEEVAINLIKQFRDGKVSKNISLIFFKNKELRHCASWSWNNRFITAMMGYNDAMGFKQWPAKNRTVKKGEKAFYILAPLMRKGQRENPDGTTETFQYVYAFKAVPVFGDTQTEGESLVYGAEEYIECLPLIEVAKEWGVKVDAYEDTTGNVGGYYSQDNNSISLATKNVSVWLHELMHKADDQLQNLKRHANKTERAYDEVVAQLGSAVLAKLLGRDDDLEDKWTWDYISRYAKHADKDPADICMNMINRVCSAVDLILTTSNENKEQLNVEEVS